MALTIPQVCQLVNHIHILVNGRIIEYRVILANHLMSEITPKPDSTGGENK
jgi:ribosomal protein S4